MIKKLLVPLAAGALALMTLPAAPAGANHDWNGYHWARTTNPFTLKVADNVTSSWDSYLDTSVVDWSKSSVLDLTEVAGTKSRSSCSATTGRVEVCNYTYGSTGWLGIAQIWASGKHITAGVVKLNDTYYNTARYNTPAWRNLVMCQEVGHTFGLGHQDENHSNANLNTCMDYTNNPESNQHPNQHDYDLLASKYAHLDSSTTVGRTAARSALKRAPAGPGIPAEWGDALVDGHEGAGHHAHGGGAHSHHHAYVKDLGGGRSVFTFVVWAS